MTKLIALLLCSISFNVLATNIEVLLYENRADYNDMARERFRCIDNSYDIETRAMIKIGDTGVRVRKSKVTFHPIGLASCYIIFLASDRTDLVLEKKIFNMKKCNDQNDEISASEMVIWTRFSNRVKLADGTRGCVVHSIRGISQD